ncbi:helix-turn-helix domain-containing protein [Undibacterium sp. Di27W]|uniref:helix-turn-helix domain-containing protein n=1 Tax=Undibacterium sp. Di27W TaxID=3413036 RepID=UPI003BF4439A
MNHSETKSEQVVKRHELTRQSERVVKNHQITNPQVSADHPVLKGRVSFQELRPGLVLHTSDVQDLYPMSTQAELDAGMTLVLVLDGSADITYGKRRFAFGPKPDSNGKMQREAALVSFAEPELFKRRSQRGGFERTVTLGVSPEWLADSGLSNVEGHTSLDIFSRTHLNTEFWAPSMRMQSLAEQILTPAALEPVMHHLFLESRAIEILSEAFTSVHSRFASAHASVMRQQSLRPKEQQRVARLHDFINSGEADTLSMTEIARQMGVNANTLQKQFKIAYGASIFEYMKERRMQIAYTALLKQGISISAAAQLAGYQNPANFSTAFKARFDTPPKNVRNSTIRERQMGLQ